MPILARAPRLDTATAAAFVRKCEGGLFTQAILFLAFGLPLCLFGPLVITTFIWAYGVRVHQHVPFRNTYWLVAFIGARCSSCSPPKPQGASSNPTATASTPRVPSNGTPPAARPSRCSSWRSPTSARA